MHIEDLITLLALQVKMNPYDSKLAYSFYDQIFRGNALTEKQASLAVKIISRQSEKINQILGKDVTQFLVNPVFRLGKRIMNNNKRVSIVPHSEYTRALKVEFPFIEEIVNKIRQNRSKLHFAQWDKDNHSWIMSFDERSINLLLEFIEEHNFFIEEELLEIINDIRLVKENFEKHVPMVSFKEDRLHFLNVPETVPQPSTSNVLESLFLARKAGINTWDDQINSTLDKNLVSPVVRRFLDSPPESFFELLLEENSIFEIKDIVQYLAPCAFVIPGGSELEKMSKSLELLSSIGINSSEISVLFRLPKETGNEFNSMVKEKGLNNPISSNTKAVFISSKVPKTIVGPEIKFNSVVNFNFYSVHYTIREFLKNHHNVINVIEKKQQRNINFAIM